jgi:BASS family bile acid:Na+ symporter/sodium/bile acid cotransporter 7
MQQWWGRNALVVAISGAIALALVIPGPGQWLAGYPLTTPLIMVIFVCQGIGVRTDELRAVRALLGLVIWGALVALVAAPLLCVAAASLAGWTGDARVGFILAGCMGPTLVTGVVIATQANGQRTTAIVLTVVLSLLTVVTIPLTLRWALGQSVTIDRGGLLLKLVVAILLPAVAGHVWAVHCPRQTARLAGVVKYLPVILLGTLVYLSLAEQAENLRGLPWRLAAQLLVAALVVHYGLLALGYCGARWGLRASEGRSRALAIVTSQKTLPVAVAIWKLAFATQFPLAILAPIVFHMAQVYADGVLARWWSRQPLPAAEQP